MRFVHLADLHIGKKVNEFSMLEDQRYILNQVLQLLDNQVNEGRRIDGVLIAGDVYDKSVPSAEAVQLLDWFLTELVQRDMPVYMVSGNHDSGERLAFGAHLLEKSGVFLKTVYDGKLEPIVLEDEFGPVYLYLLPFVKPIHVKRAHKMIGTLTEECKQEKELIEECQKEKELLEVGGNEVSDMPEQEENLASYQEAVAAVLCRAEVDKSQRNLLVAHQMVTGAQRCESEEISIGGLDNIDAGVFDDFDCVALGHLHGPQKVGREEVRYGGTLLKYSFSECNHRKSVTFVELQEKGKVIIETVEMKPLRDMRQIEGTYREIMSKDFYGKDNREDYLKIVLKDEEEIPEVLGKLRTVYPHIMKLEYCNSRTNSFGVVEPQEEVAEKSPMEYLGEFYKMQNNVEMTERQQAIAQEMIEKIWG